ncbi:MAG TPA: tetratricopeptide repeat protein [Desulfocapsa sulfexigens]|nr:tetratricopeptide repeat protein [Desulfocapsa sulfexigens]
MKQRTLYKSLLLFIAFFLLFCGGCSSISNDELSLDSHPTPEESDMVVSTEQTDSSCSYFYFLWGTHAENNKLYNEAEEAFEKALICDPDSSYILRRLPILLIRMGKQDGAAKWLRTLIEKFPNDTQDRLLLARLNIRNGKIDEAIKLYTELIDLTPEDETMLLRLGFLYSEQKRYMEAEQTFYRALSINHDSLFAHLYLARLAVQTRDMDKAATWYEKALAINWSADLALELAEFYGMQKNYKAVELQYRTILKKQPNDHRAGLGLVHTLLLQDKENEALEILTDLRANSEDPNQIDIIAARLYLRSENLEKAAAILEPIATLEEVPEATYMLAAIRYQQKKFDVALSLLHTIEKESVHHEDSIFLQVRILLEKEESDKAIELIHQTLTYEDTVTPELYTLLASLYMEQKQLQKGYDILDIALVKYPDNAKIYFEYGILLEQDSLQQQAITHMKKVLELEPDHAEALNYLGYTWAENNVNLEKALEYIQKSMQLKPGSGYIQDSLGWVYFRMGKLDLAIKEILAALQLEPNDPSIHEHLGEIYLKLGNKTKAKEAFKKAEHLFSTLKHKVRIREKIDALQ